LKDLAARKIISPIAAEQQHSHNEALFMMSRLGLFGLAALLAVYFVPAFYFWREMRNEDREIRGAAGMGLALCFGIMVPGLTDVVFLWWEVFPFYAIGSALFLAYIIRRKEFVTIPSQEPVAADRDAEKLERETSLELATSGLGSRRSTN
jgi:O-antigen ligase